MSSESKTGAALDFKIIARIIRLAKPYRKLLWAAIALTLVLTVLAPIRPILVQYTIDNYIAGKDPDGIFTFTMLILVHILLHSTILFIHTYTISIIGDLAQIVTVLAVMFYYSWELTLVSLIVLPILLVSSELFRRGVRKSFQTVRQQVSKLNSFVQEQIVGMEVVQVFGKQDQEFEKFEKINRGHLDAFKKSIFYYAVYFPIKI